MKTKDIYWIADFLDGEGSFMYQGGSPKVQVCQKDKELLERLETLLPGGRFHYIKKGAGREKRKTGIWRWDYSGIKAAGLMMTLYTLLSSRRQVRIRQQLSLWKMKGPRFGKRKGRLFKA
jgi:hypothetical protein